MEIEDVAVASVGAWTRTRIAGLQSLLFQHHFDSYWLDDVAVAASESKKVFEDYSSVDDISFRVPRQTAASSGGIVQRCYWVDLNSNHCRHCGYSKWEV